VRRVASPWHDRARCPGPALLFAPSLAALGDAPPSATTSLLLALARGQAGKRRPADLVAQFGLLPLRLRA